MYESARRRLRGAARCRTDLRLQEEGGRRCTPAAGSATDRASGATKSADGVARSRPPTIERGQSATLRWSTTDAVEVKISELGVVGLDRKEVVHPAESMTFTLTATGTAGTAVASASVAVTAPPPPPASPALAKSLEERISELSDAYFDYDRSDLTDAARAVLTVDASVLKSILSDFPGAALSIEGHCDERGSAEYNVALGDRRAVAVHAFLEQLGVNTNRLERISYGKEKPECTESTEECWHRNRRVHFSAAGQLAQEQRFDSGSTLAKTKPAEDVGAKEY